MNDTDPVVAKKYHDMLMSCSGEQRFMMGIRSFEAARAIARSSLPEELPPVELQHRLFERIYGATIEETVKVVRDGPQL